jgi:hypothetical protein
MASYFFDVQTPCENILDPEGGEWPSLRAAEQEAFAIARELWAEGIRRGEDRQGWAIEVRDDDGASLFHLPFSGVLTRKTEP